MKEEFVEDKEGKTMAPNYWIMIKDELASLSISR